MTSPWNNLFFFNEGDDEDEKKKTEEKEEKDDDKKEETSDDEYNDLLGGEDDNSDDSDDDDEEFDALSGDEDIDTDIVDGSSDDIDSTSSDDSDYNSLLDDDSSSGCDDTTDSSICGDDTAMYEKALKAAYATTVFQMNLQYISTNVIGERIYEIGKTLSVLKFSATSQAEELYTFASESQSLDIDNPIRAKEHCEDMSVADEKSYSCKDALKFIDKNINELLPYYKCLASISSYRIDIQDSCKRFICALEKVSRQDIRRMLAGDCSSNDATLVIAAKTECYNSLL